MDTLVTYAPCLGVFLAGYFAADVVRWVRRAFGRLRGVLAGPGGDAPDPAAPPPDPGQMVLVAVRKVAGHTYEIETLSAKYGRVVQKVLILPSAKLEWPGL